MCVHIYIHTYTNIYSHIPIYTQAHTHRSTHTQTKYLDNIRKTSSCEEEKHEELWEGLKEDPGN